MKIIIFGATGSIGQQSIDIIKESQHQLVGISYYHNVFLASKINAPFFFSPINQSNVSSYEDLIIKSKPDLIINAVSGFDGLEISLLSIKHKINLALANKESVVVAGSFLFKKAKLNGVTIYPIDSEHTSLMHIIRNHQQEFKRIYITASGGHFYNKKNSEINTVSYNQIIKHPTWKMGEKISIDSSTLMNKCFEIIECY
jgi:1-deoxy-D-xylulose-5-phosphate reductoisomerase